MPEIEIDTSQLTFPLVAIPEAGTGLIDGSNATRPKVSLPARTGYHVQPGTALIGGFEFDVKEDGTVDYAEDFDGFLSGRGERRLTVRGVTINIDGRALSHDVLPIGMAGPSAFLSRATVNQLNVIPAAGYGFQPGSGIVADLQYGVGRDGSIQLDPQFASFASASGNTLTIRGHTINIDGRALSHDLLPTGMVRENTFLSCATVNQLNIIPAAGYGFQPGSGIVADMSYGVGRDGSIQLDPQFASFASVSGKTLTIRGHTINIDSRALSHDLFPTGMLRENAFLSRATVNQLNVIPAAGYGFQPGSGIVADMSFGVGRDGSIQFDPQFASFASASGNTLTIRGHTINIDGRALSHDLLPTGMVRENTFLSRATVNQLNIIPAAGYGFQPGSGIVADMSYGVGRDGRVDYPATCEEFLAGRGTSTLVILGYPMVLSATQADSDLVGIANIGLRAQTPRELIAVLVPAHGYLPHTVHGVCGMGFNVERDGGITFDPVAAGSYVVRNSSSPNPSQVGEDVTIQVHVRSVAPGLLTPQGDLTFRVGVDLLGSVTLGVDGEASFRTSRLPKGEQDIVIEFRGNQDFEPSSTTVRHRVE